VRTLTDGRGVDVDFDPVGGADIRELLRSLAWGGRYLTVGFAAGEIPTVKLNQTILKNISLIGVAYGMSAIVDPEANSRDFAQLFDWYDQGKIAPSIGQRLSLADAAEALRLVYDREALGKVVIEMPR
jgi:NADPH2:quinone reductase